MTTRTTIQTGCVCAARRWTAVMIALVAMAANTSTAAEPEARPGLLTIPVPSSIDGELQTCRLHVPDGDGPRPLLVFLHSWSADVAQDNSRWVDLALERGWIVLLPDFRGVNNRPEACGSRLARQDILDAIAWTIERHAVDRGRIYLAGTSGGGHMALLMAGHHPDRFSAVSAWASISDLQAWWEFTRRDVAWRRYADNLEAVLGGPPGPANFEELRDRSPVAHLSRAVDLPLDINAGEADGRTGSVPWRHSLNAFNVLRTARGEPTVGDELGPGEPDPLYERGVFLRATSGPARLTIFEGGHEDLPGAGVAFLEAVQRPTAW
ncbi:MAG: alpha/beta fold hydrolase [Planctomyces sp.]|nr:alpha/beta fold hydrolase [Planctomyces sp.]